MIDDSNGYSVTLDTNRWERWSQPEPVAGVTVNPETELLDSSAVIDCEREKVSITPGLTYQLEERNSIYSRSR